MKSLSLASACKTEALMYAKAYIIDLETPSGILNLAKLSHSCHGKFGPAEKLVQGTKISGLLVQVDHFFLKILPPPHSPVKITV